jgi:hypothetical protein
MALKAVYVKNIGRLPIDSELEVIMREKAQFTEALGWTYRFKSGDEWVLLPLDQVAAFVYDDRPAASIGRKREALTARYADEL